MKRSSIFKNLKEEFMTNAEYVPSEFEGIHKIICMEYYMEILAPNTEKGQKFPYQLHIEAEDGMKVMDIFDLHKKLGDYKWAIKHLKKIGMSLDWLGK